MSSHEQLKKQMEENLATLKARYARIDKHIHREEALPADWEEQATELENQEVLEGLEEKVRIEITAIEAALQRFADGSYGLCSLCDEPLIQRRLEAIPWTTTCVDPETCPNR